MQVVPETQVPLPVHPVPPHCVYFVKLPPVEDGAELEITVVSVVAATDVGAADDGSALPLPAAPPGLAIEVVREPDSMYTPLK